MNRTIGALRGDTFVEVVRANGSSVGSYYSTTEPKQDVGDSIFLGGGWTVVSIEKADGRVRFLVEPLAEFRDSPTSLTVKALLLVLLLLAGTGAARAQEDAPHLMRLVDMAVEAPGSARVPTHVVLEGTVELNRKERDGDRHLRVCDGGLCIIVECIPELPDVCAAAKKGSRVWVTGITRFDGKHGWWEIHPVTALEVK